MYVLLGLAIIVTLIWLLCVVICFTDNFADGFGALIGGAIFCIFIDLIILSPVLVIDKISGTTMGTITSVDRNFWGSTAIYVRTSETTQEKYCAEDNQIIEFAKENIGNKVKVSYGTRVGLYHLEQCDQAPIDKIEVIGDKE